MRRNAGVTLVELLVALVVSSILIAAIYHTFIRQQKTYIVQEQVIDMQQNVRVAISKMMREFRMAGFGSGGGGLKYVLDLPQGVNGFKSILTPTPGASATSFTMVGAFRQARNSTGQLVQIDSTGKDPNGKDTLTLNYVTENFDPADGAGPLDPNPHRFISIGGIESNTVESRAGNVLTLANRLNFSHRTGTPVFKIEAITYSAAAHRNLNTGGGAQPLAQDIENVTFEYFNAAGNPIGFPGGNADHIRVIRVTVTAKTNLIDPEYKGDTAGTRRRTITSNIQVRNMGLQ